MRSTGIVHGVDTLSDMSSRESAGVTDGVDETILLTLLSDGRATLATLAGATGLSTSAVQARLQRLEKRGAIAGYRAVVDWDAMGLPVTAFVSVTPQDYAHQEQIPELLRSLDGVFSCYSIAGAPSYLLRVRTASLGALEDLINTIHLVVPVSTETTMVLRAYFEDEPPQPATAHEESRPAGTL